MRTASSDLILLERDNVRKPIELYHFWMGTTHWYLTSGDAAITYLGNIYNPVYLERTNVSYNINFEANEMTITLPGVNEPILDFMNATPSELIWVSILRVFRDQPVYEPTVIFLGHVLDATRKSQITKVKCVGFEFYLGMQIPKYTYQRQCNWTPFDANCGMTAVNGVTQITANVTVNADRSILTAAAFGTVAAGLFSLGKVQFGNHYRMVASHSGTALTLRYPMPNIVTGDSVTVLAGCNQTIDQCLNRFNNVANFGGWPYIPLDNPCIWM